MYDSSLQGGLDRHAPCHTVLSEEDERSASHGHVPAVFSFTIRYGI